MNAPHSKSEELALVPQQPVELRAVEDAEPAPEDEVLRRRDRGDRVDLESARAADDVEDPARGTIEQLRPHRDPARFGLRDLLQRATRSIPSLRAYSDE